MATGTFGVVVSWQQWPVIQSRVRWAMVSVVGDRCTALVTCPNTTPTDM